MLPLLLLPLASMTSGIDPALAAEGWELDWEKWCIFEQTELEHYDYIGQPQPCSAYVRVTKVTLDDGSEYPEREYMWRRQDGREVRYVSKVGGLGVGIATIGVVSDNRYDGGKSFDPAVTYAAHRNHLVIAVPNEGYEFAVCDFDPRKDGC